MARQSLLWSITPPGSDQSFFLFGTMHIRDDRAYQLCRELYPLIRASDCFIGEMDLDHPHEINMPSYDMRAFITQKKYEKVKHQLNKSFKINLDHLAHLHPLLIISFLSTAGMSNDHLVSLDEHLWQFAKEQDKPVQGLESYEKQFEILHSIEPVPLYKQIIKLSRNPGAVANQSSRGIDLYVEGRIHQLYMLSKTSMRHLRKKVIYERNLNMFSVINHLDFQKKYFISVGAGHLSGQSGLLSLLKKAGWKAKSIPVIQVLEAQSEA